MARVLYLHGFASSPGGRKATAVRDLLEGDSIELVAPDLNQPSFRYLSFDTIVRTAFETGRAASVSAVVGSSLGALVTLETIRRGLRVPALLIAPAFGIGDRWIPKLPDGDPVMCFHHAEEQELPIHRAFFEEVAAIDVDREPPPVPATVIMGRLDESVPFASVREVWDEWVASGKLQPGSLFIDLVDGDHGLVNHTDRVADEIRSIVRRSAAR